MGIGNGKNVRIKEDKWLLVNNNHTIISTLASIPVETKRASSNESRVGSLEAGLDPLAVPAP